jgi:tRNA A37 methylthiotransferase MiaB
MRRFGDAEAFLGLLDQARAQAPLAGARSNFIVGFPGETEEDLQVLCDFLTEARLDAIGVFGYSDEDGTEAEGFEGKHDEDEIRERLEHVTALAEELTAQRAEERVGELVDVLVESLEDDAPEGRAAHQGPEVDGSTTLRGAVSGVRVGDMIAARVVATDGVDLVAEPVGAAREEAR